MSEYPKTENLYASNGEQGAARKTGPQFGFRQPEVGLIGKWLVLDKLDGMNMRVIYRPYPGMFDDDFPVVQVFGRTDRAQIPGDLRTSIDRWASPENLSQALNTNEDWQNSQGDGIQLPNVTVLYGEGIGPGIQGEAGKAYGGEKRFVLFDVVVDGKWLSWDDVVSIAGKLGIEHAPVLARNASLETAKYLAVLTEAPNEHWKEPVRSYVEGGILRTDPYVFDWRGNRVMAKYKVRDL